MKKVVQGNETKVIYWTTTSEKYVNKIREIICCKETDE